MNGASSGDLQTVEQSGDDALPHEREIDQYRVIERIGEGGMGEVYRAEQRGALQRIVALKIIRLGLDSKAVIARFEAERQALALMNHPNIAKVFDGGTNRLGRPYFVMEYVAGEPITIYCDRRKLPIRQRLELFRAVCDAVQHAHTKGIIHRDLKASNVLVAEQDGKLVPKVIDFGVAKALNQRLTEKTLFTENGRLVGTPAYASPEQAEGSNDVDTRTDVYSLGVLLYELLTGALPFDPTKLREMAYGEMQRIIREVEPPRPSTFYSTHSDSSREAAQRRAATAEELASTLRHELEWIPLQAMRKERGERYQSAADFARDIENYLTGRPLIAAPDSRLYRLKKGLRRNKGPVAAAAGIVLALLLGIVFTSWQAYRATRAERLVDASLKQAELRLVQKRALSDLFNLLFAGLNPEVTRGKDTELLVAVAEEFELALESDEKLDRVDVGLYYTFLGDLYRRIDRRERASELLARGLEISRQAYAQAVSQNNVGANDFEVVRALAQGCNRQARLLREQQDHQAALKLAQEAYDAVRNHLPEQHPQWALREIDLSTAIYFADPSRHREAAALLESAANRMKRSPGAFGPSQRASAMINTAYMLSNQGQLDQAEAMYALTAEMLQEASLTQSLQYARLMTNRAVNACRNEQADTALRHLDVARTTREEFLTDPLDPERRVEWDTRAKALAQLENYSDAADAMLQAIAIAEASTPPDRHYLRKACANAADYLRQAGRDQDALLWEHRQAEYAEDVRVTN